MDEKIEQLTIAADKLKEKDTNLLPDLDIMPGGCDGLVKSRQKVGRKSVIE